MDIKLKRIFKVLTIYGPQVWLIFIAANVAIITIVRIMAVNQGCLTLDQVSADSRCLYIAQGNIYEIGSQSSPHHGHPCGSDVSDILPASHLSSTNTYLLPNFVGSICTSTPSPEPTQVPTAAPTEAPTAAPTNPPNATEAPTTPPGNTNNPTTKPTAKPTAVPTQKPGATKSPSPAPSLSPTPTPSNSPTATSIDVGNFGPRLPGLVSVKLESPTPTPEATAAPVKVNTKKYTLLYWTTIFSYITFVILLITGGYWLIQKIGLKIKESKEIKVTVPPVTPP